MINHKAKIMNYYDQSRLDNIERNARFVANLGLPALEVHPKKDSSHKKRNASIVEEDLKRKSQRLQNAANVLIEKQKGYSCTLCRCPTIFDSIRGLAQHQTRYCSSIDNYLPIQLRTSKSSILQDFMLKERMENELSSFTNDMISCNNVNLSIRMPLFDVQEDSVNAASDSGIISEDNTTDEYNTAEATKITCIDTFQKLQESFCNKVFGESYLECLNFQEIKDAFTRNDDDNISSKKKNQEIYNFVAEKGLSREDGNDLLSLLRSFKPRFLVPKSFQSLEKSARVDVASLYEYREIVVPWIDTWQMDKMPEYPPVKIYCRSLFQIVSLMLVDPEIMTIWKKHIFLNYWRAENKDGERVYSDVMTSPWSEETEKLVHSKDPSGHLMPLIFYTDGVQVSTHARNKITPVMVTLGNFSDELLQKDCSKRVIAYLPNFKGYSKDHIKTHLMETLGMSQTAVRYPNVYLRRVYLFHIY